MRLVMALDSCPVYYILIYHGNRNCLTYIRGCKINRAFCNRLITEEGFKFLKKR